MTAFASALWLGTALAQTVPEEPPTAHELADQQAVLDAQAAELDARRAAFEAEQAAWEASVRRQRAQLADERVVEEGAGFGRSVEVPAGQSWEEAISFGGDVRVKGHVTGDAVSFGGDVIVEDGGHVDQSAVSFGGRVVVHPGGTLNGDRVAMEVPAERSPFLGALPRVTGAARVWDQVRWRLVMLLAMAGAGVLTVGVFPARVRRIARDLEVRPLRAALLGSLASGFVIVFSVLLAVLTVGLGLPVSVLLLCALGIAWLLGFVGLCQAVGDRLPLNQRPYGRWLAFLVGVVPLVFLGSLPWIGWVVVGAASVIGVGGAVSTRFGSVTATLD